jgi:RNA-binding protein YhbY
LDASSRSRELEEIRKHDHDELVEMMTRALQEQNLLKIALATSTPEDAHDIVEAIEQARFMN